MSFRLYDSKERKVVDFVPVRPGEVSIYHCGLTVQSSPHLGHIRKEVVFDVLRRWLEYCGYKVTIVANITDIDDKILAKSAEAGRPWWAHAYLFEQELNAAYQALGCLSPTYAPRATGHIPEQVEMIQAMIDNGHAYVAEDGSGDVYFDVLSWSRYGELSGQRVEEMEAAADADPRGKRDPRDFALWKGYKSSEPSTASWPAPWGRGRPGWHIECSAMAVKYLGSEFDIHGGGIDLRFPHHENELAQAAAAGHPFAKYWMHNAFLTMKGEKMSKSLGNTASVLEVVQEFSPRAVRLYLAAAHYRSTMELSRESLAEAEAKLARVDAFLERCATLAFAAEVQKTEHLEVPADFAKYLDDDLNTAAAFAVVFESLKRGNIAIDAKDMPAAQQAYAEVLAMLRVFGLDPNATNWAKTNTAGSNLEPVVDGLVQTLLQQRSEARARKDWASADAIRDALNVLGLKIEDTPDGARWSLER